MEVEVGLDAAIGAGFSPTAATVDSAGVVGDGAVVDAGVGVIAFGASVASVASDVGVGVSAGAASTPGCVVLASGSRVTASIESAVASCGSIS